MDERRETIPVELPNGQVIRVEATSLGGERDVGDRIPSFDAVTDVIEGIAESVVLSLARIKPQKATVELGLELATESGKLTALLVKGTATASLKITLEWSQEERMAEEAGHERSTSNS